MTKSKKSLALVGAGVALAAASLAFAGKGILFPEWSNPTKGTFAAPATEIGDKPKAGRPWSVTTYASAITGKQPLAGQPITVIGEVIDVSCYLQVGKHGDKHRDCGQKCARNGQPVGLLLEDGTVYLLIDEEHDSRRDGLTELRKQLIENMANVVTVNGVLSEVEGQKAIYVEGSVKK